MTSIERLDQAALAVARHTAAVQPQAKFIGNIAQGLAPLAPALNFIPGWGPLAAKVIGGASMLGGGGGGGGGLGGLLGALGPAAATNALARGDWRVAEQLMNDAYNRQQGAGQQAMSNYQNILSQYKDPSISMLKNVQQIPLSALQTVNAPQINSLWSGNASQVPSLGSVGQYGSGGQAGGNGMPGGQGGFMSLLQSLGGGGQGQGPGTNPYLMALQQMTAGGPNFGSFNGSFANPNAPAPPAPPVTPPPPPQGGPAKGLPRGLGMGANPMLAGAT